MQVLHKNGRALFALWVLLLVGLCWCDDGHLNERSVAVVGTVECVDCAKQKIESSDAFSGLHVAIDCKATDGKFQTRGAGELDKDGKFDVKLPSELVNDDGKLTEECFAQLHSASSNPCPAQNGLEAAKIALKSKENGKHIFSAAGKLSFTSEICMSKLGWPKVHTSSKHFPWFKPKPKFLPPFHPKVLPPIYKKRLPPPIPFKKPPKILPPPIPKFKDPLPPPIPFKKPPMIFPPPIPKFKKPLPRPIPFKKPPMIFPPPIPKFKKPLPPPIPYKKPPMIFPPPFPKFKKPLPPPFPKFKKPLPPIPNFPSIFKKPLPPLPKLPPIYKKPLPPPLPKFPPIYKKPPPLPKFPPLYMKPLPPLPKLPLYKKPLPPLPKLPPVYKKPLPPIYKKKPLPPFPKLPPKYPPFGGWPPLSPYHP